MRDRRRFATVVAATARRALPVILCCLAGLASGARAQTLSTGVIVGTVVDDRGDPLNAVVITITNRANGQRLVARSDRTGHFGSDLLAPGRYDALFERLGFLPHRVEDILVVPGVSRDLRVDLRELTPDMTEISTSKAPVLQSFAGSSGPDTWTVGQPAATMPLEGLGLSALLRTSSIAGTRHDVEGLPATAAGVVIDGIPLTRRARAFDVLSLDLGIPLYALSQTGIVTGNPDVEYPGQAVSLTAQTRRGGRNRVVTGFGDFGSDATASGSEAPPSYSSYRAGMLAEGAIVPDTASFIVGGEVLRSRSPYDALWLDNPATASLAQVADSRFGTDLSGYTSPALESIDRESAFGRVDMRISESTSISGFAIYSSMKQPEPVAPWTESAPGTGNTPDLRRILAGASFVARIDDDMLSQVDAGFESSRATGPGSSPEEAVLPRTTIVDVGHSFGSDRSTDYQAELLAFYIRGTLHFRSGSHWRKLGLLADLPRHRIPADVGVGGSFTFATADDFRASGFGYYRGLETGANNRAEFSTRRVAVIGQDTWRPSPSVELLVGARVTSFRLPDSSKVSNEPRWEALTGQTNRALKGRRIEFEPRFRITVSPASRPDLRLIGGVMIDNDVADPSVVGEIFSNNGSFRVRTGLGGVPSWPTIPGSSAIQIRNPTLSVLGPDFRGPRTTRAFGSISRAFGAGGAVTFAFNHRRTEFLPQRVDLNLLPGVAGYDQNGRPLFGMLDKRGGMLTARYGSNRRFGTFEEVWGLQANGESRYTGLTVSVERSLLGSLGFYGSYTWSKTEDDWLIGTNGDPLTQLAPFPDSLGPENWTTGRSDLDVPHRAVAGLEIVLPGSFEPRLAALFRFQSGYPFTPGFRPGVDANADGSGYNDPAFIDESISGTSGLFGDWPCLRDDTGGFAKRNACRGPDIKGLDARFSVTFRRESEYTAAIVVDGLNLISSDAGEVDRALYIVDPTAPLEAQADGTVNVPLVINPDFGTLLTRYSPQRQLRVGVRVSF